MEEHENPIFIKLDNFLSFGDDAAMGLYFHSKGDAEAELRDWSTAEKTAAKDILLKKHLQDIPDQYCKSSITNPLLLEWLQKPNSVRNYLCLNSNGLKAMMQARNLTFQSGYPTMERMLDALGGVEGNEGITIPAVTDLEQSASNNLSPTDATIKAILQKSFLPHQKGEKREHCSMGHRLEVPILKSWIQIIKEANIFENSDYEGIEVMRVYTAGLAQKMGAPYAKDSINFLMTVKDPDHQNELCWWGFEAKGRVSVNTAGHAQQFALSQSGGKHQRIPDTDVSSFVRKEDEQRFYSMPTFMICVQLFLLFVMKNLNPSKVRLLIFLIP